MFRFFITIFTASCYALPSSAQAVSASLVSNRPGNNSKAKLIGYDYPESNLWLIARDDPVPVRLSGQWPLERGQAVSVGRAAFGSRLSNVQRNDDGSSAQAQSPLSSEGPVIFYDREITADSRRLNSDGSRADSEAVLVQLPLEVTEGLWEQPQLQRPPQMVIGRQNAGVKYEEVDNGAQRSDSATVFVPIRNPISRLPNTEVFAETDAPLQRFHQVPLVSSDGIRSVEGLEGRSISRFPNTEVVAETDVPLQRFHQVSLVSSGGSWSAEGLEGRNISPEPNGQGFWVMSQETTSPPSDHASSRRVEETSNAANSEIGGNVQEYGHVLTAEDIELLEKLGILSSFSVEPTSQQNSSSGYSERYDVEREHEDKPALIDNGGQSYLTSPRDGNASNIADVVFIDIPYFATAEYHPTVSENAGSDHETRRISPYVLQPNLDAASVNKSAEGANLENGTYLHGTEVLEILQLLNLNTGDYFNLSLPTAQRELSESVKIPDNATSLSASSKLNPNETSSIHPEDIKEPGAETDGVSSLPESNGETSSSNSVKDAVPSVSNGKIQPRLFDPPVLKENEILSRLVDSAASVSERKLLKKLQVKPYFFGFRQNDGNGTLQHRNEKSDAKGAVKGNYGYRDAVGVYRYVSYIADNNGFHAVVKTNEPGTASHNTADVVFMAETPPLAALVKMMAYKQPKNYTAKP